MDLGLGNLALVKAFVLPQAIANDTQYDAVLATIAAGVAQRFETYCNRRFGRVAGDQVTFDALRQYYILPRYPLEVVTQLELRATNTDDWTDITTAVVQQDEAIGYIYFGCFLGDPICLVRCTYTGGWWYETLEPTDVGYPSAMPGTAIALNDPKKGALSLQQLWLTQTLHEFQAKDRLLPQGLADTAFSRHDLRFEQMQLLPEVANGIAQYRRMSIV